jgi:hypothetical protein
LRSILLRPPRRASVTTAGYATVLCGPWLSQIYEAYRVRCGKARLSWRDQNDQGAKWGAPRPVTSTRRAYGD